MQVGDKAKKKIAKRHINMIEGNIASYAHVVNSKECCRQWKSSMLSLPYLV